MNVERWRQKLSALDLQRECLEPFSGDSCWLCDELEAWNCVLHPLQLNLTEQKRGVLCLSTQRYETTPGFDELDTPYHTTFFTVWLPKKHHCVEELRLTEDFPDFNVITVPYFDVRSPSNVQRISIDGYPTFDWSLLLDALGPIEQLQVLELSDPEVSGRMASSLARLLLNNAAFIKEFRLLYVSDMNCNMGDVLMCSISKCAQLTELTFDANLNSAGVRDFSTLLKSTETLEKLGVTVLPNFGSDPTMERNHDENNEKLLTAVGDLLRRNTTLTELRYRGRVCLVRDILDALETNTTLRSFTLKVCITDQSNYGRVIRAALTSMLARNQGLRSLIFKDFEMDYGVAGLMSEGLKQNTTLECLDLTDSTTSFLALQALCSAFSVNRTLQSLKVGSCEAGADERRALSAELARMQCYGRLCMHWSHWDAPGLSSALLEPLVCPSELLLDTSLFSDDSFLAICEAVVSSIHLKKLTVHFCQANSTHVKILRGALVGNKSLKCVCLHDDTYSMRHAAGVAQSFSFNEHVTQLEIHGGGMDETSACMLATVLLCNETIWRFQIESRLQLTPECMFVLNRAMVENQFITCGALFVCCVLNTSFGSLQNALQRNRTCLRKAADFVLRKSTSKLFAEAFEKFRSKEQLLHYVARASDMSLAEARAAERAVRVFVWENYMRINRVVCHVVECHPGKGTQIDQLPDDCWIAIAKYLKVSDVVGE